MSERFFNKVLSNGLVVLAQPMENVSSCAMTMLVPGGACYDASDQSGAASVASEWFLRGAGGMDTRGLNDSLDGLGCGHDESARSQHIGFSAVQLGRNLSQVLKIYSDILLRPNLDDATFAPCRDLALQEIASLDDEPAHKSNMLLREQFYPSPLGRRICGTSETVSNLSAEKVREHLQKHFVPSNAIIAVAGNVDWDEFSSQVEELFSGWEGQESEPIKISPPAGGVTHIEKDSAQVHINLAHRAATMSDAGYFSARLACTVLSGGMSSRLFTEVREKLGLVYHVSSRYGGLKGHAGFFTYAGTRPEVAQQTLDVTVGELKRLAEGITPDELTRAKTQLKSSLIMHGESTSARASAIAADWYHLEKIRTLDEMSAGIDKTTADEIMEYLREFPAEDFTMLVIGPQPLELKA